MDRNTLLAFALSMMVFVLFLMYQERQYEQTALEVSQESAAAPEEDGGAGAAEPEEPGGTASGSGRDRARADASSTADRARTAPAAEPRRAAIPVETTRLENENVVAILSNGPALIESWQLKDYFERLPGGERPIELVSNGYPVLRTEVTGVAGASFENQTFEWVSRSDRVFVQRASTTAGVLTRTFRLDESGYGFDLDLAFESRRSEPVDARFEVVWPVALSKRPDFGQLSLIAYSQDEGVHREMVAGVGQAGFFGRLFGAKSTGIDEVPGRAQWAGFDIRYFTGVVIAPGDRGALEVRFEALEKGQSAETRAELPSVVLGSGGTVDQRLRGFFGPKEPSRLDASGPGLEHTINRGWSWLEPLTRLFEIALEKLYVVIPNYGLAIIVLTVLVRAFVSPLMVKQMRSAEKMRTVQPRVKALQEKYKDDRQKQSEEMMKLWREEGVNPLGGCLPMVFQFPVLIGLFYALQSSIALRHAPFVLWIDDLSQPATLFTVPGFGFPVRLLPLVMAGSMFLQQKMTPTTGMDPAQARMMQIMMPAMMLLISYTFPSGLVLYWTVSNLLGIGHQYWIRNKMQPAS